MTLKTILLSTLCIALAITSFAQDKIYKRNGDILTAKVTEVSKNTIVYKRADNLNGPEYTIDKGEVQKIKYENGVEDEFEITPARHGHMRIARNAENINYGANIIAIAPVQVTEHGVGFGLSYERAIDKDGIISFYLPLAVTYNVNGDDVYYYSGNGPGYTEPLFYAMPGVKFYPTGMFGKIRYGVGPSLLIAVGKTTENLYDPNGYSLTENVNRFKLGVIINNSLNMSVSKHVYLGLELGLGLTYLNRINGYNEDMDGLVQFAFRVGYRF